MKPRYIMNQTDITTNLARALQQIVDAADGTGWTNLDPSFNAARNALAAYNKHSTSIKSELIKVYHWNDIQVKMMEIMDVSEDFFYDEMWEICLNDFIPDHMTNGAIVRMFASLRNEYTDVEQLTKRVIDTWNQVYQELDESGNDDGIHVEFSW